MSRGKTDEIKRLLSDGMSLDDVAKQVGVHRATVRYHLNNLKGRPPRKWQQFSSPPSVGLLVETKPQVTVAEKRLKAKELSAEGYDAHEIAYRIGGVSSDVVAWWIG